MRSFISAALLTLILAAGESAFGAQVSIGIRIGPPPPPRVVYVAPHRYRWHEGYWTLPPYARARWVAPRYEREMYFVGYWEGDHGRIEHKHHKHGHGRGHHDEDDDR